MDRNNFNQKLKETLGITREYLKDNANFFGLKEEEISLFGDLITQEIIDQEYDDETIRDDIESYYDDPNDSLLYEAIGFGEEDKVLVDFFMAALKRAFFEDNKKKVPLSGYKKRKMFLKRLLENLEMNVTAEERQAMHERLTKRNIKVKKAEAGAGDIDLERMMAISKKNKKAIIARLHDCFCEFQINTKHLDLNPNSNSNSNAKCNLKNLFLKSLKLRLKNGDNFIMFASQALGNFYARSSPHFPIWKGPSIPDDINAYFYYTLVCRKAISELLATEQDIFPLQVSLLFVLPKVLQILVSESFNNDFSSYDGYSNNKPTFENEEEFMQRSLKNDPFRMIIKFKKRSKGCTKFECIPEPRKDRKSRWVDLEARHMVEEIAARLKSLVNKPRQRVTIVVNRRYFKNMNRVYMFKLHQMKNSDDFEIPQDFCEEDFLFMASKSVIPNLTPITNIYDERWPYCGGRDFNDKALMVNFSLLNKINYRVDTTYCGSSYRFRPEYVNDLWAGLFEDESELDEYYAANVDQLFKFN